jgi:hypothetical protein
MISAGSIWLAVNWNWRRPPEVYVECLPNGQAVEAKLESENMDSCISQRKNGTSNTEY